MRRIEKLESNDTAAHQILQSLQTDMRLVQQTLARIEGSSKRE